MTVAAVLPDNPVAAHLDAVVQVFEDELRSDEPFVSALAARVSEYRGKMLRPTLLLLSAQATGAVRREHVVLAAVLEMVHVATLVHDDVLDDADIRRGAATISRLHGNEAAVLLGDYLISHAYHLCSSLDSQWAARRVAATTNTVCEGELMQVARRGQYDLGVDDYLEIIRRKTAALTSVSCELGAFFAGADASTVDRLARFGRDLGVAFQIVDDLLDLTATEAETGKSLGRDADLGKLTLPLIHFLSSADAAARRRVTDALARGRFRLVDADGDAAALHDSLEYASGAARDYVRSAIAALADLPPSAARDALAAAAEFVLRRRN
ncbi:MAG: polyprenyl synthetase family protein [Phycisphaerae bacterium]